jgi:hypothetical protein
LRISGGFEAAEPIVSDGNDTGKLSNALDDLVKDMRDEVIYGDSSCLCSEIESGLFAHYTAM